jgi:hypothetical protein
VLAALQACSAVANTILLSFYQQRWKHRGAWYPSTCKYSRACCIFEVFEAMFDAAVHLKPLGGHV